MVIFVFCVYSITYSTQLDIAWASAGWWYSHCASVIILYLTVHFHLTWSNFWLHRAESSWEVNYCLANEEILFPLWIFKIHYHVPKNVSLVPVESDWDHTFVPSFLKLHFNNILFFTARSSKWSLPFMFADASDLSAFKLFCLHKILEMVCMDLHIYIYIYTYPHILFSL